jgi:hypothetical protein
LLAVPILAITGKGWHTGSAQSFVIWVSQWEDEESAGPVPSDALEGAVDLGDPGEVEQADGDVP